MGIGQIQQNFDSKGGAVNQRFEVKYLVSEMTAQMITDYVTGYMDPDPQGRLYPVTSLYLDNDRMSMFWSSEMGERNRFKLRLRSYTDDESFQVYAEVKRRVDKVILKTRVAIHNDQIHNLLEGTGVTEEIVMDSRNPKAVSDLQYFRDLCDVFQAKPCTTVRYDREAYVTRNDEPLRITFDRELACIPTRVYDHGIWNRDAFWHTLPEVPVVLEVKFTDHYPGWVHKMIQRFGLSRTSMAKYVQCVNTLQAEGVSVCPVMEGVV